MTLSLTSSSTLQDALDQWNDNLVWEGNATKTELALEAGRYILANRPATHSHQGTSINFESIAETVKKIEASYRNLSTAYSQFTRARAKT